MQGKIGPIQTSEELRKRAVFSFFEISKSDFTEKTFPVNTYEPYMIFNYRSSLGRNKLTISIIVKVNTGSGGSIKAELYDFINANPYGVSAEITGIGETAFTQKDLVLYDVNESLLGTTYFTIRISAKNTDGGITTVKGGYAEEAKNDI